MTKPRLVVDTCVFVAAALKPGGTCNRFLERWLDHDAFDVVWSQKLSYELHENFYANPMISAAVPPTVKVDTFTKLEKRAHLVEDPKLNNPVALAHDRDDDYIVALVRSQQAILVTLDRKLMENLPSDMQAVRPGELIST